MRGTCLNLTCIKFVGKNFKICLKEFLAMNEIGIFLTAQLWWRVRFQNTYSSIRPTYHGVCDGSCCMLNSRECTKCDWITLYVGTLPMTTLQIKFTSIFWLQLLLNKPFTNFLFDNSWHHSLFVLENKAEEDLPIVSYFLNFIICFSIVCHFMFRRYQKTFVLRWRV